MVGSCGARKGNCLVEISVQLSGEFQRNERLFLILKDRIRFDFSTGWSTIWFTWDIAKTKFLAITTKCLKKFSSYDILMWIKILWLNWTFMIGLWCHTRSYSSCSCVKSSGRLPTSLARVVTNCLRSNGQVIRAAAFKAKRPWVYPNSPQSSP